MSLEVIGAAKSYGSFEVLKNIDFKAERGKVHALLGPNGAGKSTLIKCIGGVQPFSTGILRLDGEVLDLRSPSQAFDAGIATIHQYLSVVDSLSVSDNVFLGQELTNIRLLRKREQTAQTAALLAQFNIDVSPSTPVGDLAVGTKQLIEIAKTWHRTRLRVLILDEPTSALTKAETLILIEQINRMRDEGVCVMYTTHRLGEVYKIADDITVIRDGGAVLSGTVETITPPQIVAAISGRESLDVTARANRLSASEPAALDVADFAGPRFGPISFNVAAGEIVGLYGVLGAGKSSLLETLAGAFPAEQGSVRINGVPYVGSEPSTAIANGICLVPSERARQGLWSSLPASSNLLMPSYTEMPGITRLGLRSLAKERQAFAASAHLVDLQPDDPTRLGGEFSGGNQQKIVLARWLLPANLAVLLLDEPTQGVDVGARMKIYATCRQKAEQGLAIVFASSDTDEVIEFADRVIVVVDGCVVAEFMHAEITERALLRSAHELI